MAFARILKQDTFEVLQEFEDQPQAATLLRLYPGNLLRRDDFYRIVSGAAVRPGDYVYVPSTRSSEEAQATLLQLMDKALPNLPGPTNQQRVTETPGEGYVFPDAVEVVGGYFAARLAKARQWAEQWPGYFTPLQMPGTVHTLAAFGTANSEATIFKNCGMVASKVEQIFGQVFGRNMEGYVDCPNQAFIRSCLAAGAETEAQLTAQMIGSAAAALRAAAAAVVAEPTAPVVAAPAYPIAAAAASTPPAAAATVSSPAAATAAVSSSAAAPATPGNAMLDNTITSPISGIASPISGIVPDLMLVVDLSNPVDIGYDDDTDLVGHMSQLVQTGQARSQQLQQLLLQLQQQAQQLVLQPQQQAQQPVLQPQQQAQQPVLQPQQPAQQPMLQPQQQAQQPVLQPQQQAQQPVPQPQQQAQQPVLQQQHQAQQPVLQQQQQARHLQQPHVHHRQQVGDLQQQQQHLIDQEHQQVLQGDQRQLLPLDTGQRQHGQQVAALGLGQWHAQRAEDLQEPPPQATSPRLQQHAGNHQHQQAGHLQQHQQAGDQQQQSRDQSAQPPRLRPALFGEVKVREKLMADGAPLNLSALYENGVTTARAIFGQLLTYMIALQVRLGYITCYSVMWLVERLDTLPNVLFISEPILASAEGPGPTIMQGVVCAHAMALSQAHRPPPPFPPSTIVEVLIPDYLHERHVFDSPVVDASDHLEFISSQHTRIRDVGTKVQLLQQPSTQGKVSPCSSSLPYVPLSWLGLASGNLCELGAGASGVVYKGKFNDCIAAIKIMMSARYAIHEATMYRRMQPLQGQVIPVALGLGHIDIPGGLCFLALSLVTGILLSHALINAGVCDAAIEALQQLHNLGYLHGDVRGENMMLVDAATGLKVMFVDLGASRPGSQAECAQEMQQLKGLLALHT